MLTNLPALDRKQRSTTETLSPIYRKLSGIKVSLDPKTGKSEITMDQIRNQYSQLSTSIDSLQASFNNRMEVHQRQLISIMRIQINKMLEDVRKMVKVFNTMIKEKNFSQDLWETKNQVDYFKFQAFRLFEDNKSLRRQIDSLKKQIQSLNFQQKCQTVALKRLAKKLIKQKANRNKQVNKTTQRGQLSPMIKTRKRHESLYSGLHKNQNKILNSNIVGTESNPQSELKAYVQSTISQTEKKYRIKTDEDTKIDINDFQVKGHSERVNLLSNASYIQKMKYLKQRSTQCKKNFQEYQTGEDCVISGNSKDFE